MQLATPLHPANLTDTRIWAVVSLLQPTFLPLTFAGSVPRMKKSLQCVHTIALVFFNVIFIGIFQHVGIAHVVSGPEASKVSISLFNT